MSEGPRLCVVTQRAGPLTKTYTTDRVSRVEWAARQQCRGSLSSDPMIWGKSAKFPGQTVGMDHVVDDQDVVCIIVKR